MQFCPQCGTPAEDGMAFCVNCGAKIAEPPSDAAVPVDTPPKKKGKKKYAVLALAAVVLLLVFLYKSSNNTAAKAEKALIGRWNGAYVQLDDDDLVGSDVIGEFFCKASDDGSFYIDGDIFDSGMTLIWQFNTGAGKDPDKSFDYLYDLKSGSGEGALTMGYCAISDDTLFAYIRAGEKGSITFIFDEKR